MKKSTLLILLSGLSIMSHAQTITDGLMMAKGDLCTGFLYMHDSWDHYWEGDMKRVSGNIGALTTQSLMWVGTHGITPKVNAIAMVPYVATEASAGTLTGMDGIQDLTLAAKYNFWNKAMGSTSVKTFAVVAFSTPLTDYTPDFLPMSIGMTSTNLSYRLTGFAKMEKGFYSNFSTAYTWRSNVTLDRPGYYTEGVYYMTDEVKMPNLYDFTLSLGYLKHGLQADLFWYHQDTLGGDDIRRQDMPFVSNNMDFDKAGLLVMYYLPKPKGLAVRGSGTYTLAGSNVGQSTTWMGGLLYTIHLTKKAE
jgi:hypothetical protein